MELVSKIFEFNIDISKTAGENAINKRNWGHTHSHIETQLKKINTSVWEGMNKDEVSRAIAKIIYALTIVACDADIEELVKEHLRKEHRQQE